LKVDELLFTFGVLIILDMKKMIAFRKQLYDVYSNLGLDFSAITKKNIAFGEIAYDGKNIKYLSISGYETPSSANINAIASQLTPARTAVFQIWG
jgi:hypothetical protein